jgi:hypothetical protein
VNVAAPVLLIVNLFIEHPFELALIKEVELEPSIVTRPFVEIAKSKESDELNTVIFPA